MENINNREMAEASGHGPYSSQENAAAIVNKTSATNVHQASV